MRSGFAGGFDRGGRSCAGRRVYHRRRRLQGLVQLSEPVVGLLFELSVAIDPLKQACGAQFMQAPIELLAVLAELVVVRVTQGQHCKTQGFQAHVGRAQGVPETFAIVRWIAVAKSAADQRQVLGARQLAGCKVSHRAQLHGNPVVTQARGKTLGQRFGIAGLRSPQQGQRGRAVCRRRVRSRGAVGQFDAAEQPAQHTVQPQPGFSCQGRVRRHHRHATGLTARGGLQARDKTGEVRAFVIVEWRGGQAANAREIGKGLDARHGEFL
ncbi:hypothetical protein D3C86_1439060 [compost metagenome]